MELGKRHEARNIPDVNGRNGRADLAPVLVMKKVLGKSIYSFKELSDTAAVEI